MPFLNLSDLYNPQNVTAILTNCNNFIERDLKDQAFQETKGRFELWQKLQDGRLLYVKGWNKKSIICTYGK